MHERLKKWMKIEGLKSSQLADLIGSNRATISHILSGRNKPSIDFLDKLLNNYPDLNANWLITGVGNMKENLNNQADYNKKIKKVVVLYSDKSFDELSP
tara:strand:+ start:1313 stop:1609 length:297 start_codon:yes stop_codon:yes gene_type:complete